MIGAPHPAELVLGLGGNLGGDTALLTRFAAVATYFAARGAVRASRVYRSASLTPGDPPFLNAALAIAARVEPTPAELLATLHGLEASHGRRRAGERRWGPRPLDLDVLTWGRRVTADPALTVPHPAVAVRSFALWPLIDLLGGAWILPGAGRSLAALAAAAGPALAPTRYAIVFARASGPATTTG